MELTEKQLKEIRDDLDHCKKPLFFFHDDPDGLASFMLLYRYTGQGRGIVIKTNPKVDMRFIGKVKDYEPDRIFILDIAMVDQEFVDEAKVPVTWIDHHKPQRIERVKYYNPRVHDPDANIPASYLCYKAVRQDLWIAMCGCIGDWFIPDFEGEFRKLYPELLPARINNPGVALFETGIGKLVKIFAFLLKGKASDAMKSTIILTRIESPKEILEQSTSRGRFLYKRFAKIEKEYSKILDDALKKAGKERFFVYTYRADRMSFTGDLSNELLYRLPNKVIVVARLKSGEMKGSVRSGKDVMLPKAVENALAGVQGSGGGHEHACGIVINEADFPRFIDNLRKELNI